MNKHINKPNKGTLRVGPKGLNIPKNLSELDEEAEKNFSSLDSAKSKMRLLQLQIWPYD